MDALIKRYILKYLGGSKAEVPLEARERGIRSGRLGLRGEDRQVVHVRPRHRPWWLSLFESLALPQSRHLGGGLLFLYEGALPH